jgi:D-alanine transaminase
MLVYLNGSFLDKSEARVSVDDRGFLFGDGVYEVTRAVRGNLFEEDAHWTRLQYGFRETGIPSGGIRKEQLREISETLLRENGLEQADATVYVQITRGVAPRSHAFPPSTTDTTIYAFTAPFSIPADLRRTGVSAIMIPDVRWSRCDIKTLNLLPNAMAKQRAVEAGVWDSIMIRDGAITEGSAANVFGVVGGELRTYPLSNYILPGVTRRVILQIASELGIPVRETPILFDEIGRLEELFLTGTTTDVQPVVTLDGRPVADGNVGPVVRALQKALMERLGLPMFLID